ncbi:MAG: prenyltransferase [Gammaproteobacteria bacterium]|nr:prenyltransferase [Gammaproteobacteria bacterium]
MNSKLWAWLQASRLPSQTYLFLPLLLGQLLAWRVTGEWGWLVFVLVQAFGVFDQLYIVYANDVADEDTDRDNATATLYSGGSRVLVEGALSSAALQRAAWIMAGLAVASAALIGMVAGHWLPLPLAVLGIGLLWAYSFPPLRLSYRGGGELLQTLGLGAVLPLLAFSAQTGDLGGFPWVLFAVLLPLNLATAIATALPDVASDARANKRTLVVKYGLGPARRFILVLAAGALVLHLLFVHDALAMADIPVLWALGVPALALLIATALHHRADPGTRTLSLFLFLVILVNVAYVAGLAWLLL